MKACIQMKGDINMVCFEYKQSSVQYRESRYRQNNKGYQILRKGCKSILDYLDSLIPYIASSKSQLPNFAQKTTCTQNVAMDVTFHLR